MAKKETPLMKQYNSIKAKYPDALLLFRVGDFYETFGEDAIQASNILNIKLTQRSNGSASEIELAGFPHHSIDTYLPKLVKAGRRVAICDQLEDADATKSIVKRGVTEIVTPGVTFNEHVLDKKQNNFLMSIYPSKKAIGVSIVDISTGEFFGFQGNEQEVQNLIQSYEPREIVVPRKSKFSLELPKVSVQKLEDWSFQLDYATEKLNQHFGTKNLKGFGLENKNEAVIAAGAIFSYLVEGTHHSLLSHITRIQIIDNSDYVYLDSFTIRNLELIQAAHMDGVSLLSILDNTKTPMGGRLLKRWLLLPLKNLESIEKRQNALQFFLKNEEFSNEMGEQLSTISDIERLIGKLASNKISPRELGWLRDSLKNANIISDKILETVGAKEHLPVLQSMQEEEELLSHYLEEELPVHLQKGKVIKEGVNDELDNLRKIKNNASEYLEELQQRESEITKIPSLKIGFNNVHGYYLEVRNTHKDKVPENWVRRQTLANAERYITEELKEYEEKLINAEEAITELENTVYYDLLDELKKSIRKLQYNANILAQLDVLLNFAEVAKKNQYTLPQIKENSIIDIKDGRHPVIEKLLPKDEPYIANDILMNPEKQQILMITGPNMSGKSALLRQTALISLMAQIGSYVPAKHAELGLVDKIFTRVGASDNISQGESTFMVEMNETASILNNISENSLILLDEIGRGTSTYDGVSIAWAIAEYLHDSALSPKTLFATHYHELNEMTNSYPKIKNFNVSIKEIDGKIHFVRKLQKGGSAHSFGIHVAELAGMPKELISRANDILQQLESSPKNNRNKNALKITEENLQLSFFQLDDPLLENIRDELISIEIDTLTPVEALMKLNQIKKLLGK